MSHAKWLRSQAKEAEIWDQPGRAERLRVIARYIERLEAESEVPPLTRVAADMDPEAPPPDEEEED